MFTKECDFESVLIDRLTSYGWDKNILRYKTEEELIENWKNILFENNRRRDCLNEVGLTDTEMSQIIAQVNTIRTPLRLNDFVNGGSITIIRDNPNDPDHLGKPISLSIYDRKEIAGGKSKYQIAQQPIFKGKSQLGRDRRGDFMLLINGMPLIHVELKKSYVPVSQAYYQIEKYAHEGVFSGGLFGLVQIFVAMNPEEAVYFANPGPDGKFNKEFYFHWADFNNERIDNWEGVAEKLLSIPMAHMLIGFYTVSDKTDGILKVMRSYQYYASNAIASRVAKRDWSAKDMNGGYIWHTTGSGKTLTSFKTAQLISSSNDADKVIFLIDRIELGTQSLQEYRGFAGQMIDVQSTENTNELISRLKSKNASDTLIVTSIQKMSNIQMGIGIDDDIKKIAENRIVFIVDECHRSTFGEMMSIVKDTFPMAMFFGFTGTPIHEEIGKHGLATKDIFGDELHRYSIADGIRDKNVLGFDPTRVSTFSEKKIKEEIALKESKAKTVAEAVSDDKKRAVFYRYMNCQMAGYVDDNGKYIKGIEDYIPSSQYDGNIKHHKAVVEDINNNFYILSHGFKFHAILATSSIEEAIEYYHLFKRETDLKVTALFDANDSDNNEFSITKNDAIIEILEDYSANYNQIFRVADFASFKKDVSHRLAHKYQYAKLKDGEQIDVLIVVNQMLTGFDSKWINTLYVDKVLKYQNLIQAFSRTNRLFNINEKPFGIIRYYRYPNTMAKNIDSAFELFSGNKPLGLFADKLPLNLSGLNSTYDQIKNLFENAGISNYMTLPITKEEKNKFASLFRDLCGYINASRLQGFSWNNKDYSFGGDDGKKQNIHVEIDDRIFSILSQRYRELFNETMNASSSDLDDVPFDLDASLTEYNTAKIDNDYMNTRFAKYLVALNNGDPVAIARVKSELHSSFAFLSSEEQKYANIFLIDVESGKAAVDKGNTLRDYINEYINNARNDLVHKVSVALGVDEGMLRSFKESIITESEIDKFGRFSKLKESAEKDISVAKKYFDDKDNANYPLPRVRQKLDTTLRKFILKDFFD